MIEHLRLYPQANRAGQDLLDTKITYPQTRPNLVTRARLLEKLDKGLSLKTTLVTAPAGYGKSMLVAEWVKKRKIPAAWLTLEPEDNDVVRFWGYFFHALKRRQPLLGGRPVEYLISSGPLHIEKVLNIFINELNRHQRDFVIILDDFHVIEDLKISNTLKYLLDHLPTNFHIYLVGRAHPSLPLAGFRAKGYLLEISLDDLRFRYGETQEFFNKNLHYHLSREELASANRCMEGWVAGLQMASILLSAAPDKNRFFYDFPSNQRYFMDFFFEEIVSRQTDTVQEFLLQTSVLQRMNGSLCDALTAREDGQEMLEQLEQQNLFIFPLDRKRYWYRYHHLFAEALKLLLQKNDPALIGSLHKKAGEWFERNGYYNEAIHHALEGKDYAAAARWIEQEAAILFKAGEISTLLHWVDLLPRKMLYRRPKIWLYYAWALMISGKLAEADLCCRELEEFTSDDNRVTLMEEKSTLGFIESEIAIFKSGLAFPLGKSNAIEDYIQAMKNVQKESLPLKGMVRFNASSASLLQSVIGANGRLQAADLFFSATGPTIEALSQVPSFAVGYTVFSEIRYEKNDLAIAEKYANKALQVDKQEIDWGALLPAYIVLSKIEMSRGRLYAAGEAWEMLERKLKKYIYRWLSVYYAHKARIAMKKNDLEPVREWVATCDLSINDEVTIFQYYQYATMVRALLYLGNPQGALSLADRMIVLLEEEGSVGQQIEILLLQAFSRRALNLADRSLTSLEQALITGADEGYYRIFVDEGEELYKLLQLLMSRLLNAPDDKYKELLGYLEKISAGIVAENEFIQKHRIGATLTKREWEVLRLVSEGYSNQEIAELLFISLSTVKAHIQSICRKLNVNSRAKVIALVNEHMLFK